MRKVDQLVAQAIREADSTVETVRAVHVEQFAKVRVKALDEEVLFAAIERGQIEILKCVGEAGVKGGVRMAALAHAFSVSAADELLGYLEERVGSKPCFRHVLDSLLRYEAKAELHSAFLRASERYTVKPTRTAVRSLADMLPEPFSFWCDKLLPELEKHPISVHVAWLAWYRGGVERLDILERHGFPVDTEDIGKTYASGHLRTFTTTLHNYLHDKLKEAQRSAKRQRLA
jgi:hypothetical protein